MRLSKQMLDILKLLYDVHVENVKTRHGFEKDGVFHASGLAQRDLIRKVYHLGQIIEIPNLRSEKESFVYFIRGEFKSEPMSASVRASTSRTLRNLCENDYIIQSSIYGVYCKEWHISAKGIKELEKRLGVNYYRDTDNVNTYQKNELIERE